MIGKKEQCIEELYCRNKTLYIFDRHRTSFLCWIKSFNEGLIKKNNTLITIDLHSDFYTKNIKKEHIKIAKKMDIKKIEKNIKRNNDQDFIVMGMESGIIKDVVIISPITNMWEFENSPPLKYKDTCGTMHNAFYFKSIEDFEKNYNKKISKNIILDIDLDYFNKRINKKNRLDYFREGTLLNNIFNRSKIITVAKEINFTLGIGEKWSKEFKKLFLEI